jgi:hypothetical protein
MKRIRGRRDSCRNCRGSAPRLSVQVRRNLALADEWREENAERIGLLEAIHIPMLEHRAFEKWHELEAWFVSRAGDAMQDYDRREELQQALRQHLAAFGRVFPQNYWNN